MLPKRLVPALAVTTLLASPHAAQSIALTFDDGLDPRVEARAAEYNGAILAALKDAQVRSILFAAGKRVDSPEGLQLVRNWGEAGHGVANHTYNHRYLPSAKVTLAEYLSDMDRNEKLLRDLPGFTRRFRFPYLKEGDTRAKRDGVRAWLRERGYESGAVSVDASDWYYSDRFAAWRKQHPDGAVKPWRDAYLAHLWDRTQYYDGLARKTLRRSPKHVLLLHVNAINAAFLPDVIRMYRDKGWQVIHAEDAFADPLYAMQPRRLPAGESILWALARNQGVKGLRYPAEDGAYEKSKLDLIDR